jgi:hypothetical protein
MAGFEPGIFCSVGGRDDDFTTPPGQYREYLSECKNCRYGIDQVGKLTKHVMTPKSKIIIAEY